MFKIFQGEPLVTAGMILFMCIGIFLQFLLDFLYRSMIKETDNMATTENRLLKQCKLKFANCYQMNNGVANIPVFVDKFLNRLTWGPFTFETMYHLSGQSMLLSVICSGIGICRQILGGKSIGAVLPFYIVSFLELYLYFSVSSVVDVKNKRRVLKVNLIDYLENHLSSRIGVTKNDMEMLYGEEPGRRKRTVELMPIGARQPEVPDAFSAGAIPAAVGMQGALPAAAEKMDSVRISDEELADLIREFC